jgi:hypothetical protein
MQPNPYQSDNHNSKTAACHAADPSRSEPGSDRLSLSPEVSNREDVDRPVKLLNNKKAARFPEPPFTNRPVLDET